MVAKKQGAAAKPPVMSLVQMGKSSVEDLKKHVLEAKIPMPKNGKGVGGFMLRTDFEKEIRKRFRETEAASKLEAKEKAADLAKSKKAEKEKEKADQEKKDAKEKADKEKQDEKDREEAAKKAAAVEAAKTKTKSPVKDNKKIEKVKPIGKLTQAPALVENFEDYRTWKLEVEDWERFSRNKLFSDDDLYLELKERMSKELKNKFMDTHTKQSERTYQELKDFIGKKHECAQYALSEIDRVRFHTFVRGGKNFQEARESWQDLRKKALSSGGIEKSERDWNDLMRAMQFSATKEAQYIKELAQKEKECKKSGETFVKLDCLIELLSYDEKAYAMADARQLLKREGDKKGTKRTTAYQAGEEPPSGKKAKKKKKEKKPDEEDANWGSTKASQSKKGKAGKKGKAKGGKKGEAYLAGGKGFGSGKGKDQTVCRFFRDNGRCQYGKECLFKHVGHGQQAHWTEGKGSGAGWGEGAPAWGDNQSEDALWGAPKGSKGSKGGGAKGGEGKLGPGGYPLKPGDWICKACGDHQFAMNTHCRKCRVAKPAWT